MMELDELRREVERRLSPKRCAHTLGVERMAARLAARYGADERSARQAALLHDITKGLTLEEQLKLCGKYGIIAKYDGGNLPVLIHADTAAAVAAREFGAPDDVVSAIRWHTTGRPGMTLLDKLVFVADSVEEGRRYSGVEELRELAFSDLDQALVRLLSHIVEKRDGGNAPDPMTERALAALATPVEDAARNSENR